MSAFFELINKKKVYSRYSNELVTFVEDLMEHGDSKVYCDGYTLVDDIGNAETDISGLYCESKDGSIINIEDFWSAYGAYEGIEILNKNIKEIMADRD